MNKVLKMLLPVFCILLLGGCIEMQEIEKLGIINARGVDLIEDGNRLDTTLVVFQFSAQSEEFTKIISGKGKTIDGATDDAKHTSLFKLVPGKIKLSLYGKEMAEQGILPLLDGPARDARLPDLMYLAVSKTTAKEILSIDEENISADVGRFLDGLIENHSRDHNIPRKTLQDFLRIYYDIGQDNILPLFSIQDDFPKLDGLALFKGDQMVAELSNDKAILLNLATRLVKEDVIDLSLPIKPFLPFLEDRENGGHGDEIKVALLIEKGKSKIKMTSLENLTFETHTKMELRLLEQSAGIILDEPKVIEILEDEIQKNLKKKFEDLLSKLQTLESDPFGYGRYYKKSREGKDLTRAEWREKFPLIDVNFKVDADIIRHGVID